MPSFYPSAMPRQMPPTPPDYHGPSSGIPHGTRQLPALRLSTHNMQNPNHEIGGFEKWDYRTQQLQYTYAPVSRSTYLHENDSFQGQLNYPVPAQSPSNLANVASACLLPPLRGSDQQVDIHLQHSRTKPTPNLVKPKEEKPMGGVAAHLDYEMDDMVDFVSETTQGMYDIYGSRICLADIDISRSVVNSKNHVLPEFRRYVSQVLSSTRLPSSTILLGLHYLATRMTLLSIEGDFTHGDGQVYRMLTTALVLGSKFLDDNTFQNRSWSEVSNIPVSDLNALEVDWLTAIDWDMHFDPRDPAGFLLWHQQWQRYQVSKATKVEPLIQSLEQTHLDGTVLPRQQSFNRVLSPTRLDTAAECSTIHPFKASSQPQWVGPLHESWPRLRNSMEYSPPSAPETGPNTPDWYGRLNGFGYAGAPHHNHPPVKLPAPVQFTGPTALQAGFHTPYAQQYNPYGHGSACPCGYCASQHDRFYMAPAYGLQSVVG